MNWTKMRSGAVAAAMSIAVCVQAQTTGVWNVATGGYWNVAANWEGGTIPNGASDRAFFTNDVTVVNTITPFFVTNDVSVTLNTLAYWDPGTPASTDAQLEFRRTGAGITFTFAGTAPYITNGNAYHSWIALAEQPIILGSTDGLEIHGVGGVRLAAVTGSSELRVTRAGNMLSYGLSSGFTGTIVLSNASRASVQSSTTSALGTTNDPTIIYDTSFMHFPDKRATASVNSFGEKFILRGVRDLGSLTMNWCSNMYWNGTVRLETNGVIGMGQELKWIDPIWTNYISGTIEEDGLGRNLHFLQSQGGTGERGVTNPAARLSPLMLTGTSSNGGYTHLSGRAADVFGTSDMYLILAGSDNRLPTTTQVLLGGVTNDAGVNIGHASASGILILSGVSQEVAGLYALGAGTQNRVVGGTPTFGTLALNIAGGTTNVYAGRLGDSREFVTTISNAPGSFITKTNTLPYQNNLNLVKRGGGLFDLTTASNTYAGTTTVEAGTLRVSGSHPNPGAITVQASGTLIMNGDWRASGLITVDNGGTLGGDGQVGGISSSGTVSPGNSPGTLTSYGNVTLNTGSTLSLELQDPLTDPYDTLVMNGGTLKLNGTPDLSLVLYGEYVPNMGDAFTIVSGMTGFDPGIDGTFSGKPDLGTFDVSGTTFQIDYSETDIKLTVVPEPHTLGLLGLAALGGLLRRRIRR
jgi:autotransporter-associated beta strand protein